MLCSWVVMMFLENDFFFGFLFFYCSNSNKVCGYVLCFLYNKCGNWKYYIFVKCFVNVRVWGVFGLFNIWLLFFEDGLFFNILFIENDDVKFIV